MSKQGRKSLKVLVIDDQLGRDPFRQDNLNALGDTLNVKFSFCPGQTQVDGGLKNDVAPALAAVIEGGAQADQWALVLVDMQFVSGRLDENDVPAGMPDDDAFGSRIEAALLERFAGLPVVRFTTLHAKVLPVGAASPFVSKLGLTAQSLALTLVEHGRMDAATRRALIGIPDETIFESPAMFAVYSLASQYAQSGDPILILGETGVGKEHLAQFIHLASARSGAAFVPVNVADISAELFEAEMFGSKQGSYTSSKADRPGLVDAARGGTLFLDELGDMTPAHQAKVLRFIQTGEFRSVGSQTQKAGQCGVVAATSRPVDKWAQDGGERFREDLLQRFSHVLRIPPLRERPVDARLLAARALADAMRDWGKAGIEIDPGALDAICRAELRGNAREVTREVRNAVKVAQNNSLLSIGQFPPEWSSTPGLQVAAGGPGRLDVTAVEQVKTSPAFLLEKSHAAGQGGCAFSVDELVEAMQQFSINPADPALRGSLPKLEAAWSSVRQQLALAALETRRDPSSGKFVVDPAMRLLVGDTKMTPAQSSRLVNSLFDWKHDRKIDREELQKLVEQRLPRREK